MNEETIANDTELAPQIADTEFGLQIEQQAWSKEEPDTEPEPSSEHHTWSTVVRYAVAMLTTGIVLAIAAATIAIVTRGDEAGTPTPSPTTTTTASSSPTPPPPRVDTVADFKAAFTCANGDVDWMVGGADYYGGPPHGARTSMEDPARSSGSTATWQPQILVYDQETHIPYADCAGLQERLQPLGVTIVTAPLSDGGGRVRYFTAQTMDQIVALQNYFLSDLGRSGVPPDDSWDHNLSSALIANTGFCVQPDTRCERDY